MKNINSNTQMELYINIHTNTHATPTYLWFHLTFSSLESYRELKQSDPWASSNLWLPAAYCRDWSYLFPPIEGRTWRKVFSSGSIDALTEVLTSLQRHFPCFLQVVPSEAVSFPTSHLLIFSSISWIATGSTWQIDGIIILFIL